MTADIPFVDFVYENVLDGGEREGQMPCGYETEASESRARERVLFIETFAREVSLVSRGRTTAAARPIAALSCSLRSGAALALIQSS